MYNLTERQINNLKNMKRDLETVEGQQKFKNVVSVQLLNGLQTLKLNTDLNNPTLRVEYLKECKQKLLVWFPYMSDTDINMHIQMLIQKNTIDIYKIISQIRELQL